MREDILVNNITKIYNGKVVLEKFSCAFKSGEITWIMGKSGCGKTTLISIIMGIVTPDTGEILGLKGKKISVVFQENRLCQNLTTVENIKLVCGKEITEKEILKTIHELRLFDCEKKPVRKLSGGMQRRAAIARALMAQHDLLILDEPFKGLDQLTKEQVIELVKEKSKGKTVIAITHDWDEVRLLGGEVLEM